MGSKMPMDDKSDKPSGKLSNSDTDNTLTEFFRIGRGRGMGAYFFVDDSSFFDYSDTVLGRLSQIDNEPLKSVSSEEKISELKSSALRWTYSNTGDCDPEDGDDIFLVESTDHTEHFLINGSAYASEATTFLNGESGSGWVCRDDDLEEWDIKTERYNQFLFSVKDEAVARRIVDLANELLREHGTETAEGIDDDD